ncbi:hypothetical protein [Methanosarcina barkeri]|uniref:hypothetical protein n=1 Tax=Methanosarcina barkeri TaxID=2208 RepID=UPI001FB36F07|nr:hypothetical protein [Methanosarcina barkeri]
MPIKLIFDDDTVSIGDARANDYNDDAKTASYKIAECTFLIMRGNYMETKSCDDCSSCQGCM